MPDESYSVSAIQDYFENILKEHREDIDKPPVQIYVSKLKTEWHLKLKIGIASNF